MPTSTDFNPATAYRDDWQYFDGVEDGTLYQRRANAEEIANYPVKLLRADVNSPDFQRFGVGIELSPQQTAWFLWLIYPDEDSATPEPPAPIVDDAFELTTDENGDTVLDRWLIQDVQESRVGGCYAVTAVEARVNVR